MSQHALRTIVACAAALPALAAAGAAWDITDTGEPYTEARFTVTEGTWMSVDVSPDGRTLVFDLLGDIYRLPATGGEAALVLGGPAMQRSPVFSRDSTRLLYLSDASGSDNAWIANADGSGQRQVTHETTDGVNGPNWGPDGSSIVAARMPSTVAALHRSEIRLYDLRGGGGQLLVESPQTGENVHEAEVSPDGRYLYYTEKVTPQSASVVYVDANHANYAIKRRELASGATEQLIGGFGGATTPRLSRDGRRLAFVRRVGQRTVLFVYDLATREQRPVYDDLDRDDQADFIGQGNYYPRFGWFPDDRHLAIWGKGRLMRVDADSPAHAEIPFRVNAVHRITTPPRFAHELAPARVTIRAIRQIAVAPDGASLLFNALGRLWRQALPGGRPERLTGAGEFEFEPAFSSDGRRIAWVTWDDEKGSELRVQRSTGGTAVTLVASRGPLRQPAFSADGRQVVYRISPGDKCMGGYRARAGLYWVSADGGASRYVAGDADNPRFSPDGRRIFFVTSGYEGDRTVRKLESVDLDGLDRRVHATTADADTLELKVSPDLAWLAFRDRQQYYVLPFRDTGRPLSVSAGTAEVPVAAVSVTGGYELAWSADSRKVYWMLGASLRHAAVAEALESRTPPPEAGVTVNLDVPADVPSGTVAFTHARIITMRGDEVVGDGTIVVAGNRIAAVGPADAVVVPAGARVVDAAGRTIMPGLVNMHGHIDDCYYSSAGLMPQKEPGMYASLAFGITTNYDPYSAELSRYSATEMNQAGVRVGPRSINSGAVAYGRSGKSDAVYLPVASLDDARRFMARKAALGGTIVKSYRQPARAQRQQLIKAGREAGIMVDVEGESHFYNDITMILDGHTAVEHNFPVASYYDDVVQLMAHAGSATTPTLIVNFGELMGENFLYQQTRAWEDPKLRTFVQSTTSGYSPLAPPYGGPPYVRGMTTIHAADELWDIGFRSVARSMKKLDDAGVLVNAGSHGQLHGLDQHWEMWLLAQGGMSALHVLRASTLNGARTLALDAQIGSLEPGKLADLIVLDANPLEDIHNTNTVRYTMINGRLYDAATMNEIGSRERPRGRFYWELGDYRGIDWNESWAEH